MPNRHLTTIALVVLGSFFAPVASRVLAADDTAPPGNGITITAPADSSTVVNTQLEITGTAPAAVLVSISIVDVDLTGTGTADTSTGGVNGSVTSDTDGLWAFVPGTTLAAGNFEARVSYTSDDQSIQTATARFVVVAAPGSGSGLPLLVWIVLAVAIVAAVVLFRKWRQGWNPVSRLHEHSSRPSPQQRGYRRDPEPLPPQPRSVSASESSAESQALFMNTVEGRNYQRHQAERMQDMDVEMKDIARALAETAEALERSNSTIAALRHRISNELRDNPVEPEADV